MINKTNKTGLCVLLPIILIAALVSCERDVLVTDSPEESCADSEELFRYFCDEEDIHPDVNDFFKNCPAYYFDDNCGFYVRDFTACCSLFKETGSCEEIQECGIVLSDMSQGCESKIFAE